MNKKKGEGSDSSRLFADVLTFGWVLPCAIGAGAGFGWLGDRFLGTFPVLTVIFGLLGLGAGLREIYRASLRFFGDPKDKGDS